MIAARDDLPVADADQGHNCQLGWREKIPPG